MLVACFSGLLSLLQVVLLSWCVCAADPVSATPDPDVTPRITVLKRNIVERSRSVRVGDDVLLQCELSSNLARPLWTLNGDELQGYGLNSGFRTGTDGLLIIGARQDQCGQYICYAYENSVKFAIVVYNVSVHLDLSPSPPVQQTDYPYTPAVMIPEPNEPPSSEESPPPPPPPLLPHSELFFPRNMEAIYLSLITILAGMCVVLTVVLIYVGFCLQVGSRGKYSVRAAAAAYPNNKGHNRNRKQRCNSSHMELKTISSHCNDNGTCNGVSAPRNADTQDGGFLQIVPRERHTPHNKEPPPLAPPIPPTPQPSSPNCEFPNGLSATLPTVLRRMNGNSYVLLRQSDADGMSPLCYSFAEELNKMLEKRKVTQLLSWTDESSV